MGTEVGEEIQMQKIKVLPPQIANKIAAGEVVDRPAAVVKELIENSIDAGATEISVVIEQAGKELIQVIDNGTGIEPQDVPLNATPPARSKRCGTWIIFLPWDSVEKRCPALPPFHG